jgi:hypothetical protein
VISAFHGSNFSKIWEVCTVAWKLMNFLKFARKYYFEFSSPEKKFAVLLLQIWLYVIVQKTVFIYTQTYFALLAPLHLILRSKHIQQHVMEQASTYCFSYQVCPLMWQHFSVFQVLLWLWFSSYVLACPYWTQVKFSMGDLFTTGGEKNVAVINCWAQ